MLSALTIPDVCSSLESDDGIATRNKYVDWYNKWVVAPERINGKTCYYYRCSTLHQGINSHSEIDYPRIMFFPKNSKIKSHGGTIDGDLYVDVSQFVKDLVNGAKEWKEYMIDNSNFRRNYDKFVKLHPNGYRSTFGNPVIR
ncbi:MAG: hypothetical protein AAF934_07740 [Bacteroidota bacterium]